MKVLRGIAVCTLGMFLLVGVRLTAVSERDSDKKCGGYLEKCDTNKNGRITCKEARACGLKTPIKKDHPAYKCMTDRDGDGQVCE